MAKRIKNTKKGQRRGSKYPEEVRNAALCAMLTSNNIADVAKRLHMVAGKYNVPESTLRTWYKQEMQDKDGHKSLFAKAREDAVKQITMRAAQGAAQSVDLALRRLEIGKRNLERREEIDALLYDIPQPDPGAEILMVDGQVAAQRVVLPGELEEQLRREKQDRAPLSDFAVANYMRALTSVGTHSAEEQNEKAGGPAGYEAYLERVQGDEF